MEREPSVAALHDLGGNTDADVHALDRARTVIGRIGASDSDTRFIAIHRGTISRNHAAITQRDGQYVIEDLGTTNGTFVNGEPVETPRVLQDGDQVRFDVFEFEFRLSG